MPLIRLFLCVVVAYLVGVPIASANCSYASNNPTGNAPVVATMPLQGGSITVGRDIPLGTEIYRQTYRDSTSVRIQCDPGVSTMQWVWRPAVTPMPLSSWSGAPYAGKVYETGISGVGVALVRSGSAMPWTQTQSQCTSGTCSWTPASAFDLVLIKIGDIQPGVVQGSSLPSMIEEGVSGNTLTVQTVGASGAVTIVSRTCTTPDVPVELGTHRVSELSGRNTGTPWQDFAIHLNNCPAFAGYFSGNGATWYSNGTIAAGTRKHNMLGYQLNPTNGAFDTANGVIKLNPGAPGKLPAASGVGIQIADGSSQPVPLGQLVAGLDISPNANDGASYSIPLRARYLQVDDKVTPGPANGAVTFTINYQ